MRAFGACCEENKEFTDQYKKDLVIKMEIQRKIFIKERMKKFLTAVFANEDDDFEFGTKSIRFQSSLEK